MLKKKALITVYVPAGELDNVKKIVEETPKIGKLGNYNNVYTYEKSKGHFLPLEGAHPSQGKIGRMETVEYTKFETYCELEDKEEVVKILANSISYEHPEIKAIDGCVFFPDE